MTAIVVSLARVMAVVPESGKLLPEYYILLMYFTCSAIGSIILMRWKPKLLSRKAIVGFFWVIGLLILLSSLLFIPSVARIPDASHRTLVHNSMRKISVAMHEYADEHQGRLPPVAILGKKGQLLLSWRVLLLPYLGEGDLYRDLRLDEPWDSPHNVQLLDRMPACFALPEADLSSSDTRKTHFRVFTGPRTAFEGDKGQSLADDFPDGHTNTILIVEAAEAVPWTKPVELFHSADSVLPPLGCVPSGTVARSSIREQQQKLGFYVALVDGSIRFIRSDVEESLLRAVITRNGSEKLPDEW